MTTTVTQPQEGVWSRFCNWITRTENSLYIGWFGVLMMLVFEYASLNNAHSWHFVSAASPVVGMGFAILGTSTIGLNLNGFNFNGSVLDPWDDLINGANLGIQVIYQQNTHPFFQDAVVPIELIA